MPPIIGRDFPEGAAPPPGIRRRRLFDDRGHRGVIPEEHRCRYTLLRRDDPALWLGCDHGAIVFGTVLPGGDFPEGECRRPLRLADQRNVVGAGRYRRTRERVLFRDGALIQSAIQKAADEFPLFAFVHPATGQECVAGFDRDRHVWVVE